MLERWPARGSNRDQGDHRAADAYAWLRDPTDPGVQRHLDAENRYTDICCTPDRALQAQICREMRGRVELNRVSVPVPDGEYEYYSRSESDRSYPVHCRKLSRPGAPEEIILDENIIARDHGYFALQFLRVSPDHRRCLYGIDVSGRERFSLYVREIGGGAAHDRLVEGAVSDAAWANGSRVFISVRLDERNRPFQLVRHRLDPALADHSPIPEELIFEESDESFRLQIARSESGRYLMVTSWTEDATEIHYLSLDNDAAVPARMLLGRQQGIEAYASHRGREFFLLTRGTAADRIIAVQDAKGSLPDGRTVLAADSGVEFSFMQMFDRYLVVLERREGLSQLRVVDLGSGEEHLVVLPDVVCSVHPEENRQFDSRIFRFGYDSLTIPYTVYDYDMAERRLCLRQRLQIKGYDPEDYRAERIVAASPDGTRVPLSLVYRKGLPCDGSRPALLYGYGAYGFSLEPGFASIRLSLLDRGFVYAVAHVRGGGELGKDWHRQGRAHRKPNSIADFIACAEHLVRWGYADAARLAVMGESAGGLLAAAAVNERPDLFAAMVVDGPFVDVVNTLLDPCLPLTVSDWKEWGNPAESSDLASLRAFSPYDNVKTQRYPSILALCSVNDPRVPYWESLKWIARVRAAATNNPEILLRVRLNGGHQGVTGCDEELDEWAFIYAFLIRHTSGDPVDRLGGLRCVA